MTENKMKIGIIKQEGKNKTKVNHQWEHLLLTDMSFSQKVVCHFSQKWCVIG